MDKNIHRNIYLHICRVVGCLSINPKLVCLSYPCSCLTLDDPGDADLQGNRHSSIVHVSIIRPCLGRSCVRPLSVLASIRVSVVHASVVRLCVRCLSGSRPSVVRLSVCPSFLPKCGLTAYIKINPIILYLLMTLVKKIIYRKACPYRINAR